MARSKWITICVEGWFYLAVLLVLFVGALLRDINLMLVLFGMLAGPLLYNWQYVAHAFRRVTIERTVPARVGAGEPFELLYEIHNRRRWRSCWSILVTDTVQRENGRGPEQAQPVGVFFDAIPRHSQRHRSFRLRAERRGRYRCGPLRASTRFPFGLLRCTQVIDRYERLIVWPRLGRLTARWRDFRAGGHHATRHVAGRQGLLEGDYHGLRDWRSGDSPRWIHWRTTARRGELMVRQFEQHQSQDVALVLDLWQPPGVSDDERVAIERIVSCAATIVVELCRQGGSRLLVATTGAEPGCWDGFASTGLMHQLLDRLAVVEAAASDTLPRILGEALDNLPTGTPVWVLSSRAVDLSDTARFGDLWSEPRRAALLGTVRCFDARGDELGEYFREA